MLNSAKLLALCIFISCGFNLASASQPVSIKFKNSQERENGLNAETLEINQSSSDEFLCNSNPVSC